MSGDHPERLDVAPPSTRAVYQTLRALDDGETLTAGDLIEQTRFGQTTIYDALADLNERGVVEAVRRPDDLRQQYHRLATEGSR